MHNQRTNSIKCRSDMYVERLIETNVDERFWDSEKKQLPKKELWFTINQEIIIFKN